MNKTDLALITLAIYRISRRRLYKLDKLDKPGNKITVYRPDYKVKLDSFNKEKKEKTKICQVIPRSKTEHLIKTIHPLSTTVLLLPVVLALVYFIAVINKNYIKLWDTMKKLWDSMTLWTKK